MDKLKPGSEAAQRRNLRWQHNGLKGSVSMSRPNMHRIMQSSTTTPEAKATAMEISGLLEKLNYHLEKRIDP